jgi:hypothetical protein
MKRSALALLLACPSLVVLACGSSSKNGTPHPAAGAPSDGGAAPHDGGGDGGLDGSGDSHTGGSKSGSSGSGGGGAASAGGSGGSTSGTGGGGTSSSGSSSGGASEGGESAGGSGGDSGAEVVLTVTTNADVHPISPLIYGVNPANGVTCSNTTARFTLCRLGGNPWSTYNWENNASNAGADSMLCSENNDALGASAVPAATVTSLVTEAGDDAAAVVTVPLLDYVAADKTSGTPYPLCSGDITKSANYQTTRLRHNQASKGAPPAEPPDTTDDDVSQDEFLSYVKARSGTTKVLVQLDNQPELWGQTHIALHPAHTTYDEVVERNVEYAEMIRETWPGAEIVGYGGYGYYAFLNLQDAPNRPNAEFLDYYLASMKAASDDANGRLIDYLDIHWYPEFPDTAVERVQAPRSLWDPNYVEKSWIGDSVGAIELIPWLKGKVDLYYPGTKLSISSYAYGGVDDPSGGVAVADALGAFGREGVSLAALQPQEGSNTFNVAAMAAYRNYDGAGASFGDVSVRANSSDLDLVSVYASTDSQVTNRVVVVAINRSAQPTPVSLQVQHATAFTSGDVYVVSDAGPGPIPAAALTAEADNRFRTTLPGYSVSVIVPKP